MINNVTDRTLSTQGLLAPNPVSANTEMSGDQSQILAFLCIAMVIVFLAQTVTPGKWRVQKFVLIASIIAALAGYVTHRHHQEYVKAQEEAKRQADWESRISRLLESDNAVRDWEKQLEPNVRTFSAELTPLLVRQDGRPIFSIVSLRDVSTSEGGYIIEFQEGGRFWPPLRLRLRCTSEQAQLAMAERFGEYALVARIESVESMDSDASGGSFLRANGTCVDLMHSEE